MAEKDDGALYIVGVFETHVVVGRVSPLNAQRAGDLMENREGMDGESLVAWQCGTRTEMLATFPDLVGEWTFDEADAAYQIDPRKQITYERPDL